MTRIRLGRIGPTGLYIHSATGLAALYMLVLGQMDMLLISTASILLHEAAHAAVSACFGRPPKEMELTPLGALIRLEDEYSLLPGKRIVVLLAGPAASLLLCFLSIELTRAGIVTSAIGQKLFAGNVVLFGLNLMPALPLDGGRCLALILSFWLKETKVASVMRVNGTILGLAMIGLNLIMCWSIGGWNLSLTICGCFLMYSAAVGTKSSALIMLRKLVDRKILFEKRGALECKTIAVLEGEMLHRAIERLSSRRYTLFCILQTGTLRPLGQVGESSVIAAYLNSPGDCCKILLEQQVEARL